MKHVTRFIYALVLAFLLVGAVTPSTAQVGPVDLCKDPCPTIPFSSVIYTNVVVGSCTLSVHWRYRSTCGGVLEFEIDQIQIAGGSCTSVWALSVPDIVEQASLALIKQQSVEFPVSNNNCDYVQKTMRGACWRKNDAGTEIYPCSDEGCCIATYEVCADGGGNRTVTQQTAVTWNANCAYPLPGCVPVCGGWSKPGTPSQPSLIEATGATPNPSNNSTTISFHVRETANTSVTIHDIQGAKVAVIANKEYPAGDHQVIFDSSSLPNGTYYYRITGGNDVAIGKIVVAH